MDIVYTFQDIQEAAALLWDSVKDRKVLAFHGDLGSGKTTFIRALCSQLGIKDPVSSPSFSIINEYDTRSGRVYHMDLFRIKDEDEAIRAGVEDCVNSGFTCLVEWPERAGGIFPSDTLNIFMEVLDEQTRKIRVNP
jgi:tRNA threonylcarbamoyladenosine biosynthesis protein TsaE